MIYFDVIFLSNAPVSKHKELQDAFYQISGEYIKGWVLQELTDQRITGCDTRFLETCHNVGLLFHITNITLTDSDIATLCPHILNLIKSSAIKTIAKKQIGSLVSKATLEINIAE